MLEQIMEKIRSFGQQQVVENPSIPNEQNENVMREAGSSIVSKLKELSTNNDTGGLSGLLAGDRNAPATQGVQQQFAENIAKKFGINPGEAFKVADGLIPSVLASLTKGGAQGGAGWNLQSVIASLTGGQGLSGIGAKLGLDKDGDGDVDLKDIGNLFRR